MVSENVFISFCSCNQRIQAKLFSLIAVVASAVWEVWLWDLVLLQLKTSCCNVDLMVSVPVLFCDCDWLTVSTSVTVWAREWSLCLTLWILCVIKWQYIIVKLTIYNGTSFPHAMRTMNHSIIVDLESRSICKYRSDDI